jgi:hypothetical protein
MLDITPVGKLPPRPSDRHLAAAIVNLENSICYREFVRHNSDDFDDEAIAEADKQITAARQSLLEAIGTTVVDVICQLRGSPKQIKQLNRRVAGGAVSCAILPSGFIGCRRMNGPPSLQL